MDTLSPTERQALERFARALKHLRNMMGKNVSSQVLQAYLTVALEEGKSINEYATMLGASPTTASRHIMDLSDKRRSKLDGFRLLYRRDNPLDERMKVVTLSQHGKLMRQLVLETLSGASGPI